MAGGSFLRFNTSISELTHVKTCRALVFGTGSIPLYDGMSLALNQDIIVVSINYRTNVFGFPGAPDLPLQENNLGFMDQELALQWVRSNILAFGGDPNQITLMVCKFEH